MILKQLQPSVSFMLTKIDH